MASSSASGRRDGDAGVTSRRALQVTVAVLALIPLLTGLTGIVMGPRFLRLSQPWPADLDSHFRFLSGVFLAVGLLFYATIPALETRTALFRAASAMVFAGGLARLLSLFVAGAPSAGHLAGLGMELVVVPLLVLWQARVARRGALSRRS